MAILKQPIKHRRALFKADDIEVLTQLGEGNFGKVYKVLIKRENRFCAMKTMTSRVNHEVREMFLG